MMFRKLLVSLFILVLVVILFLAWKVTGSNTAFKEDKYALYIKTGSSFENVMQTLRADSVIKDPGLFSFIAKKLNLPPKIKAGKYEIRKGAGIWGIVQTIRHGKQTPVNLVITKLRTKEDFARFAGQRLECDSLAIITLLNNNDSLQSKGLDTSNVMTAIIPNTYSFFWNTTAAALFNRLYNEEKKFWKEERVQKARNLGLTPQQVYILASVIEEETNKYDEMPLMASVYINRLNKGMPLGADPTIKFASRNFAARRVTLKMISESAESPYNTYKNKGLPPGPICTPSVKTIDATLDAAATNYLYFCAKPDFSGYHAFAVTDTEHFRNARAYQKALNRLKIK
ncbi:endolytic transglycosylase MltG [Agriterribacter sp.]|uniref:endolytic transglycosylase MltG n=1 Tax=Agriterribacter sp. TaxID=2821509 RepID=UPI002C0EDE76|nr:endolytic transglycosylase MltG [Agriterribacter sp.]HRO45831.1 endolytic transglycosylase MltG [Agriterribacter sp.]HRQ16714.1 endolytic transglycosylase MltG [Agriterribacter sp.]